MFLVWAVPILANTWLCLFREQDQWIQCDDCSKWRRLPLNVIVASKWTCIDNTWDSKRYTISHPWLNQYQFFIWERMDLSIMMTSICCERMNCIPKARFKFLTNSGFGWTTTLLDQDFSLVKQPLFYYLTDYLTKDLFALPIWKIWAFSFSCIWYLDSCISYLIMFSLRSHMGLVM
jgi:hypothetical protein